MIEPRACDDIVANSDVLSVEVGRVKRPAEAGRFELRSEG
jgi:hypothetical protein